MAESSSAESPSLRDEPDDGPTVDYDVSLRVSPILAAKSRRLIRREIDFAASPDRRDRRTSNSIPAIVVSKASSAVAAATKRNVESVDNGRARRVVVESTAGLDRPSKSQRRTDGTVDDVAATSPRSILKRRQNQGTQRMAFAPDNRNALKNPRITPTNPRKSQANPRKSQTNPRITLDSPRITLDSPRKSQANPRKSPDSPRITPDSPRITPANSRKSQATPRITPANSLAAKPRKSVTKQYKLTDKPTDKPTDKLIDKPTDKLTDNRLKPPIRNHKPLQRGPNTNGISARSSGGGISTLPSAANAPGTPLNSNPVDSAALQLDVAFSPSLQNSASRLVVARRRSNIRRLRASNSTGDRGLSPTAVDIDAVDADALPFVDSPRWIEFEVQSPTPLDLSASPMDYSPRRSGSPLQTIFNEVQIFHSPNHH